MKNETFLLIIKKSTNTIINKDSVAVLFDQIFGLVYKIWRPFPTMSFNLPVYFYVIDVLVCIHFPKIKPNHAKSIEEFNKLFENNCYEYLHGELENLKRTIHGLDKCEVIDVYRLSYTIEYAPSKTNIKKFFREFYQKPYFCRFSMHDIIEKINSQTIQDDCRVNDNIAYKCLEEERNSVKILLFDDDINQTITTNQLSISATASQEYLTTPGNNIINNFVEEEVKDMSLFLLPKVALDVDTGDDLNNNKLSLTYRALTMNKKNPVTINSTMSELGNYIMAQRKNDIQEKRRKIFLDYEQRFPKRLFDFECKGTWNLTALPSTQYVDNEHYNHFSNIFFQTLMDKYESMTDTIFWANLEEAGPHSNTSRILYTMNNFLAKLYGKHENILVRVIEEMEDAGTISRDHKPERQLKLTTMIKTKQILKDELSPYRFYCFKANRRVIINKKLIPKFNNCLLYTSPSPRDA
jgi:hypothetical protein